MSADWKELTLDALEMKPAPTSPGWGLRLRFDMDDRVLLDQVAKMRGMSQSAYARRAIVAFIVHDLGLDWYEHNQNEIPIAPYGGRGYHSMSMDGQGYGDWEIQGLIHRG